MPELLGLVLRVAILLAWALAVHASKFRVYAIIE
jgi:hypothetical protein